MRSAGDKCIDRGLAAIGRVGGVVVRVRGNRRRGVRGEGYFLGEGQTREREVGAHVPMWFRDLVLWSLLALEFALLNRVSSLSTERLGGFSGSAAST